MNINEIMSAYGGDYTVHGLENIDEVGVTDFSVFVLFNVATSLYFAMNEFVPLLGNTIWVEDVTDASLMIDDELDMLKVEYAAEASPPTHANYIVRLIANVRDMLKGGELMESDADLVYAPVVRYDVPSGSGLPVPTIRANFLYAEVLL